VKVEVRVVVRPVPVGELEVEETVVLPVAELWTRLLPGVDVEVGVQVVEAWRLLSSFRTLRGGTIHPLDAASSIPSYHAWAIREYPWSVGCTPSSKSSAVT
jgi:hypothetical protein